MPGPFLTIGIVTYNSASTINPCLNSIARYMDISDTEIVIVDNNSTDATVEQVQEMPFISKFLRNEQNKGFAAGVNRIMAERAGRHLLLLNPDCEIQSQALPIIKEIFSASRMVGIIGADIHSQNGSPRESYGAFLTPSMVYWDYSGLRKLFPRKDWSTSISFNSESPREVDYPTGAFYCIRDDAIMSAGRFDERFFAYFEEVDYALRLKKEGFKAIIHPGLRVRHIGGKSFESANEKFDDDFQLTCYFDSLRYYLEKHFGKISASQCMGFISATARLKASLGGNSLFGHRHAQIARIARKLRGRSVREIYNL